jgi:hypothetical protein
MPAVLLKMDHPCFYYFFDSSRVYDDFRLLGGLFFLFRSAYIFSGPRDAFFVCWRADKRHNSRPVPESNADKCKTPNRTIGIEVEAITKLTCLRSCKPPEDGLERSLSGGFRLFAVALFSKPEVAASGFPFTRQN